MHQKYAQDGFVALSVSVDDVTDKEAVAEVEKFLRERKATIPNFLLDEEPEVWQKKLKAEAVPLVFVFDRAGRVEKKYVEAPDHTDIEKVVERLLKQK